MSSVAIQLIEYNAEIVVSLKLSLFFSIVRRGIKKGFSTQHIICLNQGKYPKSINF